VRRIREEGIEWVKQQLNTAELNADAQTALMLELPGDDTTWDALEDLNSEVHEKIGVAKGVSRVIQLVIWLRSASETCATTVAMSWTVPRVGSRSRSHARVRLSLSCGRYRLVDCPQRHC
jgi:hypothetical protein